MIMRIAGFGLACMLPAVPALADPFVQDQGEGRVIVSGVLTDSNRGFDANGDVFDIDDYSQDQVFVNFEYGVTDDLTLLFAPSYRKLRVENGDVTSGLGYTEVGARYRLAGDEYWLVSAQVLMRIPGKGRADSLAQVGNTSTDFDVRIGAAYVPGPFFVGGQAGYRSRTGDPPNEFHLDLNAGVNATDRLLLLATATNTYSDGRGTGILNRDYRYGDLFVSGVYAITDRLSFEAGYTGTIHGRNALRQRGPLIGMWLEF